LAADLELVALRQEQARQTIALDTLLGGDWTDQTLPRTSAATDPSAPSPSTSKRLP